MANNYENNILLGTDDYIFHFTDNEMRFFQVKENNRYQVLIQANSEKD